MKLAQRLGLAIAMGSLALAPVRVLAQYGGASSATQGYGAAGGYGDNGRKQPCDSDYAKFCANVDKYGMRQCILDHQAEFSSACKAQREADREAAERAKYQLPPVTYHSSPPPPPHGG